MGAKKTTSRVALGRRLAACLMSAALVAGLVPPDALAEVVQGARVGVTPVALSAPDGVVPDGGDGGIQALPPDDGGVPQQGEGPDGARVQEEALGDEKADGEPTSIDEVETDGAPTLEVVGGGGTTGGLAADDGLEAGEAATLQGQMAFETAAADGPAPLVAQDEVQPVSYRDYDAESGRMVTRTREEYTQLTSQEWWGSASVQKTWLVVRGEVAVGKVDLKGDVGLILCDGAKLTVTGGIDTGGHDLTVYAQSEGAGMGALEADASGVNNKAGISGGTVTVCGGNVTAKGGSDGAGIGGNKQVGFGAVTVYGGKVTATGGWRGSGIGNGSYYRDEGGAVTVYGGEVTATGGEGGAGIGCGYFAHNVTVTVYGGEVTATGGEYGAGIGGGNQALGDGAVTICGGKVTATGGSGGAGIGGGRYNYGDVTISDGDVTAKGGSNGAGIGGGLNCGGNVTISGGEVTAKGGVSGAGIGGGSRGAGGTVTVSRGEVTATGGNGGAGIGGGYKADGGDVTIADGEVTATGGEYAAGIGGGGSSTTAADGEGGNGGTVTIASGKVTATGGWLGAGIGGGFRGAGGDVTIAGGEVTATGGTNGAGIGGGGIGGGGDVTICGGKVTATGGGKGAGVGPGYDYNDGAPGTLRLRLGENVSLMASAYSNNKGKYTSVHIGGETNVEKEYFIDESAGVLYTGDLGTSQLDGLKGRRLTGVYSTSASNDKDIRINFTSGWDALCDMLERGETFSGKTVKLGADIGPVSRQAGDSQHKFSGTFDGQGHTLTVSFTDGAEYTAPFEKVKDATFRHLRVAGTIDTECEYCGGIVGFASGNTTFTDCCVSVVISSSSVKNNWVGNHGGFVGRVNDGGASVTFAGCVFDGRLLTTKAGDSATRCAGFVGKCYDDTGKVTLTDCLYAPAAAGGTAVAGGATFAQNGVITIKDCYYTETLGTAQGKRAREIRAGEHATAALVGNATTYGTSGVAAYGTGLSRGGALYACPGDTAKLSLGFTERDGLALKGFVVSAGELSEANGTYSLRMPDQDVTVNASYDLDPAWSDHMSAAGDGYTIHDASGWETFCDLLEVNAKGFFDGKAVNLDADVGTAESPVTRMAGSSYHDFTGTFDGRGHTLTVEYGTAEKYAAPFRYVQDGCVIENLRVAGTIRTSAQNAAGIVGMQYGNVAIRDCRSGVAILSGVAGDGTHGGLVAIKGNGDTAHLTIEGCVFDGRIVSTGTGDKATTKCGGFVGWRGANGSLTIKDCLYAPADPETNETAVTDGATFSRNGGTITNCCYAEALGEEQGVRAYRLRGDAVVSVSWGGATTASYGTSGLATFDGGMAFGGSLYFTGSGRKAVGIASDEQGGLRTGYVGIAADGSPVAVDRATGGYAVDMPAQNVGLSVRYANPADISANEAGTEYTIHNATGWDDFCDALAENSKGLFTNKIVSLGADIEVDRMAGGEGHEFTGTFDGDGHKLTVHYGSQSSPVAGDYAAPFVVVDGNAKFVDLAVAGAIRSAGAHAAGFVGHLYGNVFVERCSSAVEIDAGKESGGFVGLCENAVGFKDCVSRAVVRCRGEEGKDDSCGGFVGWSRDSEWTISFEGCLFAGKLLKAEEHSKGNGCFVGWKGDKKTVDIKDCLCAPAAPGAGETYAVDNSATFCRQGGGTSHPAVIENCYYVGEPFGAAQGKAARSVTVGEYVTVGGVSLTGEATPYGVSGITAYGGGLSRNGDLFYGSGDVVALTLGHDERPGYSHTGYQASAGTLSGDANPYALAMPDQDVTVSAAFEANAYAVAFDKNAEDAAGTMEPQGFAYDEAARALAANAYTRRGYDFAGWNTVAVPTAGNPGTAYADGQSVQNLTAEDGGTVTLYAQWTRHDYGIAIAGTPNGTVSAKVGGTESATTAHYDDTVTLAVAPAEGYALESLTYAPEGGEATDITEAKSFTMPDADVTVTATFKAAATEPAFRSVNLVLSGQIGVNFYADLSTLTEEQREAATVEFAVGGRTVTAAYDAGFRNASGAYHGFTCPIDLSQMAETIQARLLVGGKVQDTAEASVEDYVKAIASDPTTYGEKAVALAKAIADYGHYMAPFVRDLGGTGISESTKIIGGYATYTESDLAAARTASEAFAHKRTDAAGVLASPTYRLVLGSETTLRVYFSAAAGHGVEASGISVASAAGGGAPAGVQVSRDGGRWCVSIPNIGAHKLADRYVVTVTDAENNAATIELSALSYADTVMHSTTFDGDRVKADSAMTSLLGYHAAAMAYRESIG